MKYACWFIPLLLLGCSDPVLNTQESPPSLPISVPTEGEQGRLSGLVRDRSKGTLLPEITVRLDDQTVTTDPTGFYRFEKVPSGELKLIVTAPGYSPYTDTLSFSGGRQVRDITLAPEEAAQPPSALPSAPPESVPSQPTVSPTPIFLPDPLAPNPEPTATAPPVQPTPTPQPTPTATPAAYDPLIDEVRTSDLFVKREKDHLTLTLSLQRTPNGPPIAWSWGNVSVTYTLGKPLQGPGELDQWLPLNGGSGSTQLVSSQDNYFPVFVSPSELDEYVFVYYEATLPNGRILAPVRAAYRIN